MLFVMLSICSNYAKNNAFSLHYAKLFQILLDYASHQKCMPINRAGQNKCLYCRNPYLKAFKHCRGTGASQTRSLKEKRKEECRKVAGLVLS